MVHNIIVKYRINETTEKKTYICYFYISQTFRIFGNFLCIGIIANAEMNECNNNYLNE